jgi:hypothetical protein
VETDQHYAPIERLAKSEEPHRQAWSEALGADWQRAARTIKKDGPASVLRASLLQRDVVVKQWVWRPTLKGLFGLDRASRQWRGAQWLEAHGFPTARCLVLATSPRANYPHHRYLVMEAIEGTTLLEHLARHDLTVRQQHTLARALARQLVALTLAGRYNRDHKPSNLIVQNLESGEPTIAIIDTVAIRKLRPWRRADLYAMFISLVLEPVGCGCPPRRPLMMRVVVEHQRELLRRVPNVLPADPSIRRAARHQDWMRIAGLIDAHGDPTPRIDPLA